tara:strand:- start:109 stop:540 length:432 start_codon:yes stop_codon:yes gene_type:complete
MDDFDKNIIDILESDGRASNAEIARKIGVSEGTIRRRLKKLIDNKTISVLAISDPRQMGYEFEALVGIQVDPGLVEPVAEAITKLTDTKWVSITTGTYDVFAWVILPTAEALGKFLRNRIGEIQGVKKTETFVSLQVVKRELE